MAWNSFAYFRHKEKQKIEIDESAFKWNRHANIFFFSDQFLLRNSPFNKY